MYDSMDEKKIKFLVLESIYWIIMSTAAQTGFRSRTLDVSENFWRKGHFSAEKQFL